MNVTEIPIGNLRSAPWNPNQLDADGAKRLSTSLARFGLVQNLVVRPLGHGRYEVLSGNQRVAALQAAGAKTAPCVVVKLDDASARLLAQALNRIHGEDDLGLRAELVRRILQDLPEADVLAVLPDGAEGLRSLATLGQQDLAENIAAWQRAQAARLRHLQVQLTESQLQTVEEALGQALSESAPEEASPNRRGTALAAICRDYLVSRECHGA